MQVIDPKNKSYRPKNAIQRPKMQFIDKKKCKSSIKNAIHQQKQQVIVQKKMQGFDKKKCKSRGIVAFEDKSDNLLLKNASTRKLNLSIKKYKQEASWPLKTKVIICCLEMYRPKKSIYRSKKCKSSI